MAENIRVPHQGFPPGVVSIDDVLFLELIGDEVDVDRSQHKRHHLVVQLAEDPAVEGVTDPIEPLDLVRRDVIEVALHDERFLAFGEEPP